MPYYPSLLLRNGTYYHQVRVPVAIVATYGKRFERRSLRTKNLREAAARLAIEDERVKRLFEEHCRAMNNDVSPNAPTSAATRSVDLNALASRYASEVTDREYAERSAIFLELQRRMESEGTAEALFRGEVVPLPPSDYLDHVLANEEIEVHAALATILRVRLQERVAALELALAIGNFAPVALIVEAELPSANDRERRQLSRLLMKAEIDALQTIVRDATAVEITAPNLSAGARRLEGDGSQREQQTIKVDQGQTLSVVAREWITEKGRTNAWVEKTRHEREAAVRIFIEICGDRPIGAYRKSDAREFKEILFSIPPNAHKKREYQGKTARKIAEEANAKGDPRASAKNVSLKMDAVASLFVWACANYDEVSTNPFEGTKPKVDKAPRDERDPFTSDELKAIFATAPFTGAKSERNWLAPGSMSLRSTGKFWVPLIALYTGARLMEIVQLRKGDVREKNGVTYFDLNDDGDKRVKTRAARRHIPVHPVLVKAGLMSHVASVDRDEDRLFGDIAIGSEKNRSGPASKLFARLIAAANVKTRTNCFHSFRHTFEDACRAAHIEAAVMNALQGHAESGMAGRYGSGFTLERLSAELRKITYDGLAEPQVSECCGD